MLRWPCLQLLCQSHGMDALFAGSAARQEMVLDKKAPQHQSRCDGQPTEETHHSQLSQAAGSDQRRQGEYASSLRRLRAFTRTARQVPTRCRAGDVRARRVCGSEWRGPRCPGGFRSVVCQRRDICKATTMCCSSLQIHIGPARDRLQGFRCSRHGVGVVLPTAFSTAGAAQDWHQRPGPAAGVLDGGGAGASTDGTHNIRWYGSRPAIEEQA